VQHKEFCWLLDFKEGRKSKKKCQQWWKGHHTNRWWQSKNVWGS